MNRFNKISKIIVFPLMIMFFQMNSIANLSTIKEKFTSQDNLSGSTMDINFIGLENKNKGFSLSQKTFIQEINQKSKDFYIDFIQNTTFENKTSENSQSFLINAINNTIYNVTNLITYENTIYNIKKPFDQNQFATNIECKAENCPFPNVCLNKSICACNNLYANFYQKPTINPPINDSYCTYKRKNQVTLSLIDLLLPGFGFVYVGHFVYGFVKFLGFFILYTIILSKLLRYFKKDQLPIHILDPEFYEYKKDFHYYLMIVCCFITILWQALDLILISFRVRKDPFGVGFQVIQIFPE